MSIQSSVTVILAIRPRLLRELLHHALDTAAAQFRVVEVADAMPAPSIIQDADWLVVDEESANDVLQFTGKHPNLGVLALEGRGSRARVVGPATAGKWEPVAEVLTLAQLFELLSHEAVATRTHATN